MAYKDSSKLKKSKLEDLSEIEVAEFQMFVGMEVEAVLARLGNSGSDFKKAVAVALYSRII